MNVRTIHASGIALSGYYAAAISVVLASVLTTVWFLFVGFKLNQLGQP